MTGNLTSSGLYLPSTGLRYDYPRVAEFFDANEQKPSPLFTILTEFWMWIADGNCYIVNEKAQTVPLTPNDHQIEIFQAMLWQAARGLPIRLVVLKSRKAGCSTLIQALFYYCARRLHNYKVTTVAHVKEATQAILDITRLIHQHDPESLPLPTDNVNVLKFAHGSQIVCGASGQHFSGSGGTPFALHISELSKWQGDAAKVIGQMQSLLNALPIENVSICVIESTANMSASTPEFEDRFRKAFKKESNFIAIFGGWWMKPSCRMPGKTIPKKNAYEAFLVKKYGVDDEQIAWYRYILIEKANGQMAWMKQEYPSFWEEAFQSAQGKIFPTLERAKHDRTWKQLNEVGFRLEDAEIYRGIDFGGGHPFVCVWLAHWPGSPGFSIDVDACINTWNEHTGYAWDKNGRPRKDNDHTVDAVRYVITSEDLGDGYTHVFQEVYIDRAADLGYSDDKLAKLVRQRTVNMPTPTSSRADRSRPTAINGFNDNGVYCEGQTRYRGIADLGEVKDGIGYVNNLFQTGPLVELLPPERDDPMGDHATIRAGSVVPVGVAKNLWGRSKKKRRTHEFFGHAY